MNLTVEADQPGCEKICEWVVGRFKMGINYKEAGVDIEKGDELVSWLREDSKDIPHKDKIVSGIGGFAALFRADFKKYRNPCIVSATDGVGTKVVLAAQYQRYEHIGQDLVAMCVNDLLCCGADPLFFLDYFACGQLNVEVAKSFLTGLRKACREANCALIGGETAEMPGVYQGNDFDCAGFAVGVVDEDEVLGPHKVSIGDLLIGFPSSGFHSNGYSLLRKVFEKDMEKWLDILMRPTHLYTSLITSLRRDFDIRALAHITGGGLDNILRVIPDGCAVDLVPWKIPDPFLEVKKRGEMSWESLLKTLNCGIGMCMILSEAQWSDFQEHTKQSSLEYLRLGKVVAAPEKRWNLSFSDLERLNYE